ncbi:hypothetical protein MPER_06341 [Moniliophthora perniciosa FA553]|nr:hypothetical protein MPER_06341 [Moniliophthora perniciosa FA553]
MHNSTPQIIVVGLGNLPLPGTRHSLGQLVIDALSDRLGIQMSSDRKGVIGRDIVTVGETNVQLTLYKSKAAMNISGPSIADAFRNSIKQGTTHNLIVLQDSDGSSSRSPFLSIRRLSQWS